MLAELLIIGVAAYVFLTRNGIRLQNNTTVKTPDQSNPIYNVVGGLNTGPRDEVLAYNARLQDQAMNGDIAPFSLENPDTPPLPLTSVGV
jgi:hypothetical protein